MQTAILVERYLMRVTLRMQLTNLKSHVRATHKDGLTFLLYQRNYQHEKESIERAHKYQLIGTAVVFLRWFSVVT